MIFISRPMGDIPDLNPLKNFITIFYNNLCTIRTNFFSPIICYKFFFYQYDPYFNINRINFHIPFYKRNLYSNIINSNDCNNLKFTSFQFIYFLVSVGENLLLLKIDSVTIR